MPATDHTTSVRFGEISRLPGYRFGDDGSVWSRWRKTAVVFGQGTVRVLGDEWIRLNPIRTKKRYLQVTLRIEGAERRSSFRVHRLILEAFVGPCPPGMVACHNNGDRTDNRLCNLRWDTQLANVADSVVHGTKVQGERQGVAKLTVEDVVEIRRLYDVGESMCRLARRFGMSESQIGNVVHRRQWAHVE